MTNDSMSLEELIMLVAGFVLVAAGGVTFGLTTIVGVALIGQAFGVDVVDLL